MEISKQLLNGSYILNKRFAMAVKQLDSIHHAKWSTFFKVLLCFT